MDKVKAVESRLLGPTGAEHLNDLRQLFELSELTDLQVVASALQAIAKVLSHHRRLVVASGDAAGEAVVTFLRGHGDAYHATLAQLAQSGGPRMQACAVRLVMSAARDEAEDASESGSGRWSPAVRGLMAPPVGRLQSLLTELLLGKTFGERAAQTLLSEFVADYADVRLNALSHLRACFEQAAAPAAKATEEAEKEEGEGNLRPAKRRKRSATPFADALTSRGRSVEELFVRGFALLKEFPQPTGKHDEGDKDDGSGDGEDEDDRDVPVWLHTGKASKGLVKQYRRKFQDAWLKLLNLRVPAEKYKILLQFLPGKVMPHLGEPLLLADFYLRAFDGGSAEVSVLSLSGLFLLLTKHGLGDLEAVSSSSSEYYAQLYSLIRFETFSLKQRSRFQRLMSASLASGLLPARFAAVFAKKCMRTAVACAEAGTVMWLIALAYSLIQTHHSHCEFLLHRADAPADDETALKDDPFDMSAPLGKAIETVNETSLWEVQLLRRHHAPAVATLAKLFLQPFFKATAKRLEPEAFLDQSAAQLYKQAMRSGERQAGKLRTKGERIPMAFQVEEDDLALRVAGWAATLSTTQRQVGVGL